MATMRFGHVTSVFASLIGASLLFRAAASVDPWTCKYFVHKVPGAADAPGFIVTYLDRLQNAQLFYSLPGRPDNNYGEHGLLKFEVKSTNYLDETFHELDVPGVTPKSGKFRIYYLADYADDNEAHAACLRDADARMVRFFLMTEVDIVPRLKALEDGSTSSPALTTDDIAAATSHFLDGPAVDKAIDNKTAGFLDGPAVDAKVSAAVDDKATVADITAATSHFLDGPAVDAKVSAATSHFLDGPAVDAAIESKLSTSLELQGMKDEIARLFELYAQRRVRLAGADGEVSGPQGDDSTVDCNETEDQCTEACESAAKRNYKVLRLASAGGKACVGPTDCAGGDGKCPASLETDEESDGDGDGGLPLVPIIAGAAALVVCSIALALACRMQRAKKSKSDTSAGVADGREDPTTLTMDNLTYFESNVAADGYLEVGVEEQAEPQVGTTL